MNVGWEASSRPDGEESFTTSYHGDHGWDLYNLLLSDGHEKPQVILIGSMTDLQLTPEAATFLNYEEPNLATRNEGIYGRSENEARRTDWLETAWQLEFENSRMELSNYVEGGEAHLKKNLNFTSYLVCVMNL